MNFKLWEDPEAPRPGLEVTHFQLLAEITMSAFAVQKR